MRYRISNLAIRPQHGYGVLEDLARIVPEWAHRERDGRIRLWQLPSSFDLVPGSDLANRIFETLHKHGLKRHTYQGKEDPNTHYYYITERNYSPKDLEGFEFYLLELMHQLPVACHASDKDDEYHDGLFAIASKGKPKKMRDCVCGIGSISDFYASTEVMERIRSANFKGLVVRPTLLVSRGVHKPNPDMWEIGAKEVLPKPQPNPERFFSPVEPRYLRSDFRGREDVEVFYHLHDLRFDTEERASRRLVSPLIVARRFFEWWKAAGFKGLRFVPVHIIKD
jgi:hypothetical protein